MDVQTLYVLVLGGALAIVRGQTRRKAFQRGCSGIEWRGGELLQFPRGTRGFARAWTAEGGCLHMIRIVTP